MSSLRATGHVTTGTDLPANIGNSTSTESQRPFDGLLDNFRIWGEDSGSAGALSLAALENVRTGDLSNIPEPATSAAIAGLGILALVAVLRRSVRRGKR